MPLRRAPARRGERADRGFSSSRVSRQRHDDLSNRDTWDRRHHASELVNERPGEPEVRETRTSERPSSNQRDSYEAPTREPRHSALGKVEWWAEDRPSIPAIERACEREPAIVRHPNLRLATASSDTEVPDANDDFARNVAGSRSSRRRPRHRDRRATSNLRARQNGDPDGSGRRSTALSREPKRGYPTRTLPDTSCRHPETLREGSFAFVGGRSERRLSRVVAH